MNSKIVAMRVSKSKVVEYLPWMVSYVYDNGIVTDSVAALATVQKAVNWAKAVNKNLTVEVVL